MQAKIRKPIEPEARKPWARSEEAIPAEGKGKGSDGPTGEAGEFWTGPYAGEIQRAMIETLRKARLRTDEDVSKLIAWLREPKIGRVVNCQHEDHQPPFRLVADVLTGRVLDYIAWANRSGGKTYLAGLIAWVSSGFTAGLETTVLGGSFEQSGKVYEAMNGLWGMTGLQEEYLLTEPTKKKTRWKNGSLVSVLTASTRSTRGPHPHRLILDEVDEMKEDVYRAALSQPMAKRGIRAGLGKLSTNHKFGGMMDEAVAAAKVSGVPVYKWCIWEVMGSCRDLNCSTCRLSPWCPGQHMKESLGYYNPEDFIQKLENLNEQSLQIEWLCNKIGRSDLVYGAQFEEDIHAGLGIPEFDPDRRAFISLDWGGTDPFSLGVWQEFDMGWVRVDEIFLQNSTNTVLISQAKKKPWWGNVGEGVGDPSRPDLIKEWAAAGIRLIGADNEIDAGIETVRNCLQPILGPPRFFVNRHRCRAWLTEVKSYLQKNGHPVDRNNHAMDETRYFCRWKLDKPVRRGRAFFIGRVRPSIMISPGKIQPSQNSPIRNTMAAETAMSIPTKAAASPGQVAGETKGASNENSEIKTEPGQRPEGTRTIQRGRVFFSTGNGRRPDRPRSREREDLTGRPKEPEWDD